MDPADFNNILRVNETIRHMESAFVVTGQTNYGAVDWMAMRNSIGVDRWRSYVRLRVLAGQTKNTA